ARSWPDKRPDLSHLVRAVEDALTAAGLWVDDAQVVEIIGAKRYPNEGAGSLLGPGALIRVIQVTP
ncbi:MAG TPA: RusA family crossover junction endodeoxyribonuclease, partial [Gemmatimonadales bacterium]|nr:RusA family crossover junction endodeoxyribonuclease [Gemmatimonadales bacterium]